MIKKLLPFFALLFLFFNMQTASAMPSWHSWSDVQPFPNIENIDFSNVRKVHYEVYDINATDPQTCPTHCFRVAVYVNDQLFGIVPTSPGSQRHDWGGRTPLAVNAPLVNQGWGYRGYRLHGRGYLSNKRKDNLRYFTVFMFNGRDIGIGFHGDKDGRYSVTGRPESHGCMRLTDNNAQIVNYLARAVIDNTGSGQAVTLTTNHTRAKNF